MSSRIPGAARWYEGISPEKLDQEAAILRPSALEEGPSRHHRIRPLLWHDTRAWDRNSSMVRVAPTPEAIRTSDIDTSIERTMRVLPGK